MLGSGSTTAFGAVCIVRFGVDARLRIGFTGALGCTDSVGDELGVLRVRRTFGVGGTELSMLSVTTVDGLVLTARRRQTFAAVSFGAVLDFARRGKLEASVGRGCRGFRGRFVEGC